ncbi:uncharacterized protein F4807DRAFT_443599 [Annulohypoxylon truncatum]|uniref:uncharacterized protein n=1 Tax=Annulohypoxylon truncatum TaxID=327061 RepID=UPI0020086DF7|nr:uncharacterized protein F4807DRAFT_443599 [Annulohypoxylon truncatum]KAI1205324.1 hypothetical protein F4807DRAFT_443599 [Annulohypoxylon truncatum]
MSSPSNALYELSRNPNTLFALSDESLLSLIYGDFKDELGRLMRAYSVGGVDDTRPSSESPSVYLYGRDYDEVNRTLTGLLTLKWTWNGQYDTLIANQAEALKLSRKSFEWMRTFYKESLLNPSYPNELYALITSIVVNDIGKDDQLALDYEKETGENIANQNHDMILIKAVRAGLVKCLNPTDTRCRLSQEDRDDIIRGMELGAEFNFGQLAQAENAPACLAGLATMRGHPRSFRLRFEEQLLDIAGAAGHLDWTCAKKLTQSNFDAYRTVYDVGMGMISEGLSLRAGYDLVLTRRLNLLIEKKFRPLDLNVEDDRALARLLCMGSVADLKTAELYNRVWTSLEDDVRKSLRKSLNIDGSVAEPAVQVTYIPALITQAVDVSGPGALEMKERAMKSALRYLCKVMSAPGKPDGPVSVIERNVLAVIKGVVQSPEFRKDPTILESAPIPESLVAKTESTDQRPG